MSENYVDKKKSSAKNRRNSILKTAEKLDRSEFEFTEEVTTNTRKLRRVSFSTTINVKEIEALHMSNSGNESITAANTRANAKTVALMDISNLGRSMVIDDSMMMNNTNSGKANYDEVSMEIDGYDSILPVDQTVTAQFNNTCKFYDMSSLASVDTTLSPDAKHQDSSDNDHENSIDTKIPNNVTLSPLKPVSHNMTYDVVEQNMSASHIMHQTAKTMDESGHHTTQTKMMLNATYEMHQVTAVSIAEPPSFMHTNTITIPETSFKQKQEINRKLLHMDCANVSSSNLSFSLQNKKSAMQLASLPNPATRITPMTDPNDFDLPMLRYKPEPIESRSLKALQDEALSKANIRISDLKQSIVNLKQKVKAAQKENADLESQLIKVRKEKENEISTIKELKESIDSIRLDAIKKCQYEIYQFKSDDCQKLEKELKSFREKESILEREYQEKSKKYEELKEIVETKSEKIKQIQVNNNESKRLLNLYQHIFNEKTVKFKIANISDDSVMLTFFYDLIQLEIKSTNLFRDVNFRSSLKHCSSMDEFMSRAKYYDYPLEKIICKSFIDLHGDHIPSSYDRKSRKSSNTTCLTRIPDYVKYCIKLIMGEIESDIDKTTKYTTVKDLPLLITKINMAVECASNLAKDFDQYINGFKNTNRTVQFNFKKYIVSFVLASVEDDCFYRLNLSIRPAMYYQCPISFTIDQQDLDEPLQPNSERIGKVIQDMFFEKGSFKEYFKKLKAF